MNFFIQKSQFTEKEKEAERIKRRIVINCQVRINLEEELAALKRFKKSEKKK